MHFLSLFMGEGHMKMKYCVLEHTDLVILHRQYWCLSVSDLSMKNIGE